MTAAELLRRAETRAFWSRVGLVLIAILAAVGSIGYGLHTMYDRAFEAGRSAEKDAQFQAALQNNSDKLRLAAIHRDSTKAAVAHADSVVARVDSAATTHRDTSRSTISRVTVASDTGLKVDSLPPITLPRVAVDAYRNLLEGRARDSVDIAALKTNVIALTADVAAADREKAAQAERVSILEDQAKDHAQEVKTARKAGYWSGVKAGTVATVSALGAATILVIKFVK